MSNTQFSYATLSDSGLFVFAPLFAAVFSTWLVAKSSRLINVSLVVLGLITLIFFAMKLFAGWLDTESKKNYQNMSETKIVRSGVAHNVKVSLSLPRPNFIWQKSPPPTAVVTTASASRLTRHEIKSIKETVAETVPGLSPSSVTVSAPYGSYWVEIGTANVSGDRFYFSPSNAAAHWDGMPPAGSFEDLGAALNQALDGKQVAIGGFNLVGCTGASHTVPYLQRHDCDQVAAPGSQATLKQVEVSDRQGKVWAWLSF